ncbi:MAG TPA: hypothetical protein VFB02_16400 [Bradyrhizobium sp.]|jgi:hypothetical protein|nr:hypothetical protein [Bradyrhizobium sp.]
MKKLTLVFAVLASLAVASAPAEARGWGHRFGGGWGHAGFARAGGWGGGWRGGWGGRRWGGGWGWGPGVGLGLGLAAGALAATTWAPYDAYAWDTGYDYGPYAYGGWPYAYAAPTVVVGGPVWGPPLFWGRRRFWHRGWW